MPYTQPPTISSRILELTIFNVMAWIPHPLGTQLRKLIYPLPFASIGKKVSIHQRVKFVGAGAMEISANVEILRNTRLEIKDSNSFIFLGKGVYLDCGVDIRTKGSDCWIEIGDRSYLGVYVTVAGPGNIKIGKNCHIASHSAICANHKGVEIEDNCCIGSRVKILDGVTIGRGSVIEAGAFVAKNISPDSIIYGVPTNSIR